MRHRVASTIVLAANTAGIDISVVEGYRGEHEGLRTTAVVCDSWHTFAWAVCHALMDAITDPRIDPKAITRAIEHARSDSRDGKVFIY